MARTRAHLVRVISTVVFLSSAVSAHAQQNLLTKPGFEQYVPPALGLPGWVSDTIRQTPATSETSQPHTGTKNGACRSASSLDCGIYQDVTAPSTGTYTLSFYANADRSGGLVGADKNGSLARSLPVAVRGAGVYGDPYVMSFSATAGDTIHVWMYSPATPGYVVIDDVSLTLAVAPVRTTALTWNIQVGHDAATRQAQMDQIAALSPQPQILLIQEASKAQYNAQVYQAELQARTGQTWSGDFRGHCPLGAWDTTNQTCTVSEEDEGVMILTSYPVISTDRRWFAATDCWHSARGGVHAAINVNGFTVHVFNNHLPTGNCSPNDSLLRQNVVAGIKSWAAGFGGIQIVGGDYNAEPSSPEIADTTVGMGSTFANVSGSAPTWPANGPTKKDDYWFTQIGGRLATVSSDVVSSTTYSDHLSVRAQFDLYSTSGAYTGTPVSLPGHFEAENFDNGGQDIAYHDSDLFNNGGVYRPDQSVDIQATSDAGGGYNVGWFSKDEWMQYSVSATSSATYTWYARVASPCSGGVVHLEVNSINVGTVAIPNTGGWQNWTTVTLGGVTLPAGTSLIRVYGDNGTCGAGGHDISNLNWFEIQ